MKRAMILCLVLAGCASDPDPQHILVGDKLVLTGTRLGYIADQLNRTNRVQVHIKGAGIAKIRFDGEIHGPRDLASALRDDPRLEVEEDEDTVTIRKRRR